MADKVGHRCRDPSPLFVSPAHTEYRGFCRGKRSVVRGTDTLLSLGSVVGGRYRDGLSPLFSDSSTCLRLFRLHAGRWAVAPRIPAVSCRDPTRSDLRIVHPARVDVGDPPLLVTSWVVRFLQGRRRTVRPSGSPTDLSPGLRSLRRGSDTPVPRLQVSVRVEGRGTRCRWGPVRERVTERTPRKDLSSFISRHPSLRPHSVGSPGGGGVVTCPGHRQDRVLWYLSGTQDGQKGLFGQR